MKRTLHTRYPNRRKKNDFKIRRHSKISQPNTHNSLALVIIWPLESSIMDNKKTDFFLSDFRFTELPDISTIQLITFTSYFYLYTSYERTQTLIEKWFRAHFKNERMLVCTTIINAKLNLISA